MDRNQLIGITLITALLITYAQFFAPKTPIPPATQKELQSTATVKIPELPQIQEKETKIHTPAAPAYQGPFAPFMEGTEKEVVLENEAMKVTLTSRGGSIKEVTLKHYQDHKKQTFTLLDSQSSYMGFQLNMPDAPLNSRDLFFEACAPNQTAEGPQPAEATFLLAIGPHQYIRQVFSLPDQGYTLTHHWEIVGLGEELASEPVQFVWHNRIRRAEKDLEACRNKSTINYYLANNRFGHLKEHATTQQEKLLQSPVQWVGIKQRFFTAGIVAQEAFAGGHVLTTPTHHSRNTVKEAQVCLTLPEADPQQDKIGQFRFYFGPNDHHTLSRVAKGFSKNVSLGWPVVRWINQFLIMPVFAFLERFVSSYGVIIFLLVVFIKVLLLPLSYRSYLAMAKMQVLRPALDAIKAKHGSNMQRVQMEQMSFYREMGINPLSGCVPVLLQMPILLAMFNFFPNVIALRQQAFLWASDLSTYDAVVQLPFAIPAYGSHVSLFTLLMTASTILYTWYNNQLTPSQEGPMKAMMYIMPLVFMVILNNLPAGLSFYYFVSNLVTIGQQKLIKRLVNEEKIKKKLKENKRKNSNKKKSRLQLHLEDALRAEIAKKKKVNQKPLQDA